MRALGLVPLVALLAGLAPACATVTVRTDHDPYVDFSRYRTFSVLGGQMIVDGRRDDSNTVLKDRIQDAITAELASKGLQPVGVGGDLLVGYVAGARTVTEMQVSEAHVPGYGPYGAWGGWWGPAYQDWWNREYTKGTLVIDLMDAENKRLVWRAYTQADVTSPGAKEIVHRAVQKAFGKFPPRPAPIQGMERVSTNSSQAPRPAQ
jgi:hypothetical protein